MRATIETLQGETTVGDAVSYLRRNYLTLEEVLQKSGVEHQRLLELIAKRCVPPHSHRAIHSVSITTNISGTHTVTDVSGDYYHRDTVQFVRNAERLALSGISVDDVAVLIKERFAAEVAEALGKCVEDCCEAIELNWAQLHAGTFGVCLQKMSPSHMIKKQRAVYRIEKLLNDVSNITESQIKKLEECIADYNSVASDFGPHEVAASTRGRVVSRALTVLSQNSAVVRVRHI